MKNWYVGKTGNHQGLVIEEGTGKNIAVAYDKKDAPLLAAAPILLLAAKCALADLEGAHDTHIYDEGDYHPKDCCYCETMRELRDAIQKAEGGN